MPATSSILHGLSRSGRALYGNRDELEVFQSVLGPEVKVERTDHIQAGARRCVYLVTKAKVAGRK